MMVMVSVVQVCLPTYLLLGCFGAADVYYSSELQLGLVCFDGVAIWISDLGFFGCVVFWFLAF